MRCLSLLDSLSTQENLLLYRIQRVVIDSISMTVTLPMHKKQRIIDLCQAMLGETWVCIRSVAKLLGIFSSSFVAVPEGKLHYRSLEREKTKALTINRGNYVKFMRLTEISISEICWWKNNILDSFIPICRPKPAVVITTDASMTGWGACRGHNRTGGLFDESEIVHINVLEARAVVFGLQALCEDVYDTHIKVMADNT